MAKPTRRLGRGLDSLVSNLRSVSSQPTPPIEELDTTERAVTRNEAAPSIRAASLPAEALTPNPQQPRSNAKHGDVLSLARSIEQTGILQPIVVRCVSGRYQIIAGERRWRAARSLGMTHVPVIVRDATDDQMLEFALIENIQREDLNAIDRAKAYRQFCDRFSLKAEQVATRLCEDRTTVANYIRLLELPDPIKELVAAAKLSMGHARCLLGIKDDAECLRLAESAVENQLSVRALEEVVRREKRSDRTLAPKSRLERRAHLRDLERRFEEAIKTKVTIQEGKRKSTGRVVIEYYSLDDFDRIAELLGVTRE